MLQIGYGTNLDKNKKQMDIHSYNQNFKTQDEMFDFIEEWLPRGYSNEVNKILGKKSKLNPVSIRRIKTKRIKNSVVMNALYKVAEQNRLQMQKI